VNTEKKVQINKNWRILNTDSFNWQIQKLKGGKWGPWSGRDNFYGRVTDALNALPATMLQDMDQKTLQGILDALKGIREDIAGTLARLEFTKFDEII
jgi:hypothetical protein